MDLEFKVIDNKYTNIAQLVKNRLKISSRLFLKLRNYNKIYLNRKDSIYK